MTARLSGRFYRRIAPHPKNTPAIASPRRQQPITHRHYEDDRFRLFYGAAALYRSSPAQLYEAPCRRPLYFIYFADSLPELADAFLSTADDF